MVVLLTISLTAGGCSLFHQDLPNEPPVLQTQADTLRVKRQGSVTLAVLASDEDDDPLSYTWIANGGTLDTTGSSAEWIAPDQIEGASQVFTVHVTVLDRQCDLVPDRQDRLNCQNTAHVSTDSFRIEVVQSPPSLPSITHDEPLSFREPAIAVAASATDDEGDLLTFMWSVADTTTTALLDSVGSEIDLIPLFPGQHVVVVTVHDRADTTAGSAVIDVPTPTDIPTGGSIVLELPAASQTSARLFEIDVFEYPNERGTEPLLVDSFFEAERICSEAGARLCTDQEWTMACAGEEGRMFSSIDDPDTLARFGRRFCNTPGSALNSSSAGDSVGVLAVSGSFPNCSSSAGVFDLTGNAREWLAGRDSIRVAVLSPSSAAQRATCQETGTLPPVAQIETESDSRYFESGSGFRCCRDLEIGDVGAGVNKVGVEISR